MKFNFKTSGVIAIILLLLAVLCSDAFAQVSGDGLNVRTTLEYYSSLISKRGWMSTIHDNELRAFRFNADYDKITVRITPKTEGKSGVFDVEMKKNDRTHTRRFSFDTTHPNFAVHARNAMSAFLLSHTIGEDLSNRAESPYFGRFAFGYARTSDTDEVYPEMNMGGYYISYFLEYAPARLAGLNNIPLRFGDFITMELYAVAPTDPVGRHYVTEHFFNFDFIVYGTHLNANPGNSLQRTTYGFYMGMEFFRPGWKNDVMLWSHELYTEQPHLQYCLLRVLSWGYTTHLKNSWGEWSAYFMTGIGPSINSSLFAVDWDKQEAQERSQLFQGLTGSKQNYYYSSFWSVSANLAAERIWRLRFSFGYDFYYFFSSDPAIDDHAFDVVHILKPSAGVYLLDNLLACANYEHWRVYSDLEGAKKSHAWNRLVLELRYIF